MNAYNESELLQLISEGNENAFRQLFNTYSGRLYAYVLKMTESKEIAEDTVHDIFLKIWTRKEKLPVIQNINAYLYKMAHNHTFNGFRRMAKETLVMAELEKAQGHEQSDPGDILVRKEIRQFINDVIDSKLTPRQKKIFFMSREEGLKQEEIARRLNISVFTVKKHMVDALSMLRNEISNSYPFQAVALYVLYKLAY